MKKLITIAGVAALALAAPVQAKKPDHAGKPERAAKVKVKANGKGKRCAPKRVGYNARGTLVVAALTQTAGADTPDETGDDRYSGTVEVDVKKANHRAPKGPQTFTLADARVKFADADGDGVTEQPSAGDVVKVHGKITRLNKRCDTSGFTPDVTVRKVGFKPAPAPAPAG